MTPEEWDADNNASMIVLYYIKQVYNVTPNDLSNICIFKRGENHVYISEWLSSDFEEPTIETLLSYNLSDVLIYYNQMWVWPDMLTIDPSRETPRFKLVDISNFNPDTIPEGCIIWNLDTKKYQAWDGTCWNNLW
jgi:hypothetical protein